MCVSQFYGSMCIIYLIVAIIWFGLMIYHRKELITLQVCVCVRVYVYACVRMCAYVWGMYVDCVRIFVGKSMFICIICVIMVISCAVSGAYMICWTVIYDIQLSYDRFRLKLLLHIPVLHLCRTCALYDWVIHMVLQLPQSQCHWCSSYMECSVRHSIYRPKESRVSCSCSCCGSRLWSYQVRNT